MFNRKSLSAPVIDSIVDQAKTRFPEYPLTNPRCSRMLRDDIRSAVKNLVDSLDPDVIRSAVHGLNEFDIRRRLQDLIETLVFYRLKYSNSETLAGYEPASPRGVKYYEYYEYYEYYDSYGPK